MGTIHYYGIIAVNFSGTKKHPHHISEVLLVEVDTSGNIRHHEKVHPIAEVVQLEPLYTMVWNYNTGKWARGAAVDTEQVKGTTYLRSRRNNTEEDNLSKLSGVASFLNSAAK
jgi:hypothetical protein